MYSTRAGRASPATAIPAPAIPAPRHTLILSPLLEPRGKLFWILPQTNPNCRVLDLHATASFSCLQSQAISVHKAQNCRPASGLFISYGSQSQKNRSQVSKQYLFSHKLYQMNI